MPLNIKDDEIHRRAREHAELTHSSITHAVAHAVTEALRREKREKQARETVRLNELFALVEEAGRLRAAAASGDTRTDDEILGYDANGIPL